MTTKVQKPNVRRKPISVKEWLELRVRLSDKTQIEINRDAGFGTPNMLTLMKSGHSKVPWPRAAKLAEALDAKPEELYRVMLEEYIPDVWAWMNESATSVLSPAERAVLEAFRATGIDDGTPEALKKAQKLAKMIGEAAIG